MKGILMKSLFSSINASPFPI